MNLMEERKTSPKPLGAPVTDRASVNALVLNISMSYLCLYGGFAISVFLVKQTRLAVSVVSSVQVITLGITKIVGACFSPLPLAIEAVFAFYGVSSVGVLIGANFLSREHGLILLIVVSSVQGTVGIVTLCVSTQKLSISKALTLALGIDTIFFLPPFNPIYISGSLLVTATLLFVADAGWHRKYNWAAWALAGCMSIISGTLFIIFRRTPAVGGVATALLSLAAILVILTLLQSKQMSKKEKLAATTCVAFYVGGFIAISWNKNVSGFTLGLGIGINFIVLVLGWWLCYSLEKPKQTRQTRQTPVLNLTEPAAAESAESAKTEDVCAEKALVTKDVLVDIELGDVFVDIELDDSS